MASVHSVERPQVSQRQRNIHQNSIRAKARLSFSWMWRPMAARHLFRMTTAIQVGFFYTTGKHECPMGLKPLSNSNPQSIFNALLKSRQRCRKKWWTWGNMRLIPECTLTDCNGCKLKISKLCQNATSDLKEHTLFGSLWCLVCPRLGLGARAHFEFYMIFKGVMV